MVRLIAAVLIYEGKVVQTRRFKVTNIVGDVRTAVKFFAAWDVDELMLIDISPKPWPGMLSCVAQATENVFIPVTVGGHITSLDQIRELQIHGADRILVRKALWEHPRFITDIAMKHGSQCVVAGFDGLDVETPQLYERLGAGEILLNSTRLDGTKEGFDLETISRVSAAVGVPVIAMGGAGKPEHFAEAVKAGASAAAAGNIFHYMEHATVKAKEAMREAGLPVRRASLAVL